MSISLNSSYKHLLLLGRNIKSQHSNIFCSKRLCKHSCHSFNHHRSDYRSTLHCILMKLLQSKTILFHKRIIYNNARAITGNLLCINPVYDCHILKIFMRNILKHRLIFLYGYNLHHKPALYILIFLKIRKSLFNIGNVVKSPLYSIGNPLNY